MIQKPIIDLHNGVFVARDDLYPPGTKGRYFVELFKKHDHIVYASSAEGGAQTALAHVAKDMNKKTTIFVARRKQRHERTTMAERLGAKIIEVKVGYLNVVQYHAKNYAEENGFYLLPFGAATEEAEVCLASHMRLIDLNIDETWCASGSGLLARSLHLAFPHAEHNVVCVGHKLSIDNVYGAKMYYSDLKYRQKCFDSVPFPCDQHYEAKAWQICMNNRGSGNVLFWNVTKPAEV